MIGKDLSRYIKRYVEIYFKYFLVFFIYYIDLLRIKGNNMGAAIKYFMLGFRNAFAPIKLQTTKELGQISIELFEKRKALIEKERDKRKATRVKN